MRKCFVFSVLSFLLGTLPTVLDSWLSLRDRFFGEGEVLASIPADILFQNVIPVVGLAGILLAIWWTRDKVRGDAADSSTSSIGGQASSEMESIGETDPTPDRSTGSTPEFPITPEVISVPNPDIGMEENNSPPPTLLNVSAADLMGIFDGRTTVQAQPLVEKQIGNWVQIKGKVTNVRESYRGGHSVSLIEPTNHQLLGARIHAHFGEEWSNTIRYLTTDQEIIVLGRITEIDALFVDLESCSLGSGLRH